MEDEIKRMQAEIAELRDVIRGRGTDGGMIHAMLRLAELMHGTKENPGGIAARIEEVSRESITRCTSLEASVMKLQKVYWMGVGAMAVLNFAWMVFVHFHKP